MTKASFEEFAKANFGLRKLVRLLADNFEYEAPSGFPIADDWFIARYLVEVNVHVHENHEAAPTSTDWTDTLCFLASMDVKNLGRTDLYQVTTQANDPITIFKALLCCSDQNAAIHFRHIFAVKRTEDSKYYINIHVYSPAFFQMIVLDDPELLDQVVLNKIKINGVQLELPPEVLLGDYTD